MAIVERGQMYSLQVVGQRCSGSGWGVPFNTQRGVKVFIDFDQDGVFNPNTENVLPLAFQGTGTGWTPTYNVFNVMIPATAQTGTTHMRVVYSRQEQFHFLLGIKSCLKGCIVMEKLKIIQ